MNILKINLYIGGVIILIKYIELLILLSVSVVQDIKTYKVKNTLTICFMCIGIITNLYLCKIEGLTDSLLGIFCPIIILWILFRLRILGAGDIKIFSAIGAINGVRFVLYAILFSFLVGGVIGIVYMITNKDILKRMRYFYSYIKAIILTQSVPKYNKSEFTKFPFSSAIIGGVMVGIIMDIK
ncbi:A24 family peptidase [Clostridiaceae bacterium M8S5]|nr:A24 family peptidase [Clostridiaceae bacterium M8S5]